jgi:uncharacterized SAM-binding protein YcdF (DUF218 family)
MTAITPFSNVLGRQFGSNSDVRPSGAIVVLGAGVTRGGMLNNESLRRVIRGIELYREGLAPVLVLSGASPDGDATLGEANVRAKLAATMGVPADAIIQETTANTTQEEAIHIGQSLRERGVREILLVTESLHMRRAKLVFEKAGLEVHPAVSADYSISAAAPADRFRLMLRLMQEATALVYVRLLYRV